MTTAEKQIPVLRFPEFEKPFEEKRLKNVFSIFNGYAFSSKDSCENGCRWVKIADVGINKMKSDSASFLPLDFRNKHKKFILREGDYVVALTRPILRGELKIAKITKEFSDSLLNQRVGKLITKNNLDFVYFLLQKSELIYKIENRIAGTDPPNLSPSEINSLITFIPTLPEQQKIADFLSAVDRKMAQLTRQKALLEQYKKGVMQKIFARELRFKKDDGSDFPDWEEKRLGDLTQKFSIRNKKLVDAMVYSVTNYAGFVPQTEHFSKEVAGVDLTNYKIIRKNDFAYNPARINVGSIAHFSDEIGVISSLYVCLRTTKELLDSFLTLILSLEYTKYQINNLGEGGVRIYLWYDLFALIKCIVPCLDEQKKVVYFAKSIDNKIQAVNSQLEKTQNFKKGLLQQMFV